MADDETAPDLEADERMLAGFAKRPLGPADHPALARLLGHASKPLRLKAAATLAEAVGAQRVPASVCDLLLDDPKAEVRWGTAFAASRSGVRSNRVVDVAVEALDFEDGDVRWAAAAIVTGEARDSEPLRARLRSLASGGSPRSRKMALLCLCDSGSGDGALYRRALGDEDPFVRLAAVTSMGRSGDASQESLDALRLASDNDEDVRVRRGAGAVLSRLAPQRS